MRNAESVLGAVARQPARFLQLKRIRDSIYTTIAHLDADLRWMETARARVDELRRLR